MSFVKLEGKVQTVLGPVDPQNRGSVMSHEHLLINFLCMFRPPEEVTEWARAHEPLTISNLGWVRHNWFSNKDNLLLTDERLAILEATLYKNLGGGAIVDVTTIGIGRDPRALARIARATGLNVIMGAGYYVGSAHPINMDQLTVSDICKQIVTDIRHGVEDTNVRAGIIGEIGCTWPLAPNEIKVLKGAAAAQQETGAAILIHPGRDEQAPRAILDVLSENGADLTRTIMGHLDRTVSDIDALIDVARSGCYLEWDRRIIPCPR